ncbi:TPA: RNA-directed DNA polymerase, partial [Vibrio vulnificus]|nr:RNA-directed DNA polymerase [Vibrio vulnificus]
MIVNKRHHQIMERELLHCAKQCNRSTQSSVEKINILNVCHDLSKDILDFNYKPKAYTRFAVKEPKLREIFAPSFSDRLVHCWLSNQLPPLIENTLIDDTYANRKGKGTLAAITKVQKLMRMPKHDYFLQLDVQSFFNHINKPILLQSLHYLIQNKGNWSPFRTRIIHHLTDAVVNHDTSREAFDISGHKTILASIPYHKTLSASPPGTGLPIGSMTSQIFANYYLNPLDHYIKHTLRVKGYVRYMDDLILLSNSKAELLSWKSSIENQLQHSLKLNLHPTKQTLKSVSQGANYLGYILYPHYKHIRASTLKTLQSRLNFFNWLMGYSDT